MKRVSIFVFAAALAFALAVPAFATGAGGMGRMYGDHIRTEARAGMLGPEVHPGMHFGFHGWTM